MLVVAESNFKKAEALYDRIVLAAMKQAGDFAAERANAYLKKAAGGKDPKITLKVLPKFIRFQDTHQTKGISQILKAESLATSTSLHDILAPQELKAARAEELITVEGVIEVSLPQVEQNDLGTWAPTDQQVEKMWAIFADNYFTKLFDLIGRGVA